MSKEVKQIGKESQKPRNNCEEEFRDGCQPWESDENFLNGQAVSDYPFPNQLEAPSFYRPLAISAAGQSQNEGQRMPLSNSTANSSLVPNNSQHDPSPQTTNVFFNDFNNISNNDLFWQYVCMAIQFNNGGQAQQGQTRYQSSINQSPVWPSLLAPASQNSTTLRQLTYPITINAEQSSSTIVESSAVHPSDRTEQKEVAKKSRKRSYRHDRDRGSKVCKECNVTYRTKEEYWVHNRQTHDDGKLNRCPVCVFSTKFKHHYDYHLRGHIRSKPYRCTKCDYRCINQSMLRSHISSHRRELRNRCKICSETFKTLKALEQHVSTNGHQVPLQNLVELPVSPTGFKMLAASIECCNRSTGTDTNVQQPKNASELLNTLIELLNKSKLTGVKEIVQDAVLDDEYADQVITEAEMYAMNLSSHLYCDRCDFCASSKDEIINHLKEHVERAKPGELVDVIDEHENPTDGSDNVHESGTPKRPSTILPGYSSSPVVSTDMEEKPISKNDSTLPLTNNSIIIKSEPVDFWTPQPERKHRRKEAKPVKLSRSLIVPTNGEGFRNGQNGDHPRSSFSCNICWTSFNDSCSYLTHLSLHDRDEPLRCTKCKKLEIDFQKFKEHRCCRL
ncbi:hypothetical protein ACOME3_000355 [Neoechinorhynchus agilis]